MSLTYQRAAAIPPPEIVGTDDPHGDPSDIAGQQLALIIGDAINGTALSLSGSLDELEAYAMRVLARVRLARMGAAGPDPAPAVTFDPVALRAWLASPAGHNLTRADAIGVPQTYNPTEDSAGELAERLLAALAHNTQPQVWRTAPDLAIVTAWVTADVDRPAPGVLITISLDCGVELSAGYKILDDPDYCGDAETVPGAEAAVSVLGRVATTVTAAVVQWRAITGTGITAASFMSQDEPTRGAWLSAFGETADAAERQWARLGIAETAVTTRSAFPGAAALLIEIDDERTPQVLQVLAAGGAALWSHTDATGHWSTPTGEPSTGPRVEYDVAYQLRDALDAAPSLGIPYRVTDYPATDVFWIDLPPGDGRPGQAHGAPVPA